MINISKPKKTKNPVNIEQEKISAEESILYITIPENSFGSGYCVIHSLSGQIKVRQELSRGKNMISQAFAKGQYFITLSLGQEMTSNKVEIK